jgi:LuxR family maltose regulon positive regulatory protein
MASQVRQRTGTSAGHVPRLPRAYVARARLWAHLDEATQGAVTLLVGPGGAGKTLGVSGWLRQTGRAQAAGWVEADETWSPERLRAVLDESEPGEDGSPRLVVVDDAHLLPIATVRALDERLDTAPESFRVLLISRWDLPFTRLGAELLGHLTSLRGELLRLDEAESGALVAAHAHTDSAEIAEAIAERTQGWCAAVVLTARAVAGAPDPIAVARRYAEGDASVADRVASEVFAVLQPRERHLLLCVANEPVVTPALAIHLSHDPRAGEALAHLESIGLLVTRISAEDHDAPSDEERDRYTIHPLLAEVVRRRTTAGGVDVVRAAATVRRAVQLDLARGSTADAFRRLVDVGDHTGAARLLADEGTSLVLRGQGAGINAFALQQPSAIEVAPGAWFAIAMERWFIDEIGCARHWLDRIIADPLPESPTTMLQVACVRLMRSRLGLESMPAAVANAELVLARGDRHTADALVPVVLCELAITQNWLGDLPGAEVNLTTALRLSRSRDLPALTAIALSHLAFTEYMRGREAACFEVADEALAMIDGLPGKPRFSAVRVRLARELAALSDLPWRDGVVALAAAPDPPVHSADLTTKFWVRMRRSRIELALGSLSAAVRALDVPLEAPSLPDHLAVALLLERAFLASLAGDGPALMLVEGELVERGAAGEAALAAGLRADLSGDRRTATTRFVEAAETAQYRQPAVRALALATAAQLTDELGDETGALDLLDQALVATEVRRNAVPFLGWSRHGSRIAELLQRLAYRHPSPWLLEVMSGMAGMSEIATYYGPSTALPGERTDLPEGTIRPTLSPRERDVLYELARGSTYADIAANLFVSENTVKTHVSSLYAKLSVNRRSAALAAARSMNLL